MMMHRSGLGKALFEFAKRSVDVHLIDTVNDQVIQPLI